MVNTSWCNLLFTLLTENLLLDLARYVYVGRSGLGGEGLFAKTEISPGTVFAYFGGNRHSFAEFNATIRSQGKDILLLATSVRSVTIFC